MEISKAKTSVYASLGSKKFRLKYKLFAAEGHKCMQDTLPAFTPEAIVATESWIKQHGNQFSQIADKIVSASSAVMSKISSLSSTPEVIGIFKLPDVDNKINLLLEPDLYLVIDGVQDPGNLGTIIRTADWFGIHTIFASTDTVDIYNPKTVQATMGALARVKVVYTDLLELFKINHKMPIFGTLLNGKNIYNTTLSEIGFIVIGNEGNGISKAIRKTITHPILIPSYGDGECSESLNVGVATAIVTAEFRRRMIKTE